MACRLIVDRRLACDLFVELSILSRDFSEKVRIDGDAGSSVVLKTDRTLEMSQCKLAEVPLLVTLSPWDLDEICAFLLVYYRDGFHSIDHISIELESESGSGPNLLSVEVQDVGMHQGVDHPMSYGQAASPSHLGKGRRKRR
jgi:hypothetical protein